MSTCVRDADRSEDGVISRDERERTTRASERATINDEEARVNKQYMERERNRERERKRKREGLKPRWG